MTQCQISSCIWSKEFVNDLESKLISVFNFTDSPIPDILRHVLLEYCSISSILLFRSDISLLRSSMTELNFSEIAFLNDSLLISKSTACSVRRSSFLNDSLLISRCTACSVRLSSFLNDSLLISRCTACSVRFSSFLNDSLLISRSTDCSVRLSHF